MKIKNKRKRQSYFINEAVKIIESDGIEGFSARKIATSTGYNLASIYTYFDNLEHLLNLSCIEFIIEYSDELSTSTSNVDDPLIAYLIMWELFVKHSLKKPKIFYNVFYSSNAQNSAVQLFTQYYEIFPEKTPKNTIVKSLLKLNKTEDREGYLLRICRDTGIIEYDKLDYIRDIHLGYFNSILNNLNKQGSNQDKILLYHKFILDFLYSMIPYVNSKYGNILDEMLKFHEEHLKNPRNSFSMYTKNLF